jgi:hypothetical protein
MAALVGMMYGVLLLLRSAASSTAAKSWIQISVNLEELTVFVVRCPKAPEDEAVV